MSEDCTPYLEQSPGDLITAEKWNQMQCLIQDDIRVTAQEKVDALESVAHAGDSDKLEGKSADELADAIVERAIAEIRARRGYLATFRILKLGEPSVIRHDFGAWPLVDVYRLDYYPVVCCEDKDIFPALTTFYLYHSSEKKIRYPAIDNTPKGSIEIEPRDGSVYRIPFADMLERYKVEYTGKSSLGDLENEFWKAFFADPNDEFDDDQYCHSPWFEKCCREEHSVKSLKEKGDWDDLWFMVRPRKTINYPAPVFGPGDIGWEFPNPGPDARPVLPAPTQVQVSQYDLKSVGLTLLAPVDYPPEQLGAGRTANAPRPPWEPLDPEVTRELKVMVLLKC